jgi:hypothetical protein
MSLQFRRDPSCLMIQVPAALPVCSGVPVSRKKILTATHPWTAVFAL